MCAIGCCVALRLDSPVYRPDKTQPLKLDPASIILGSVMLQDVRDALIGRTFGLAALVRAGLVRDTASASKVLTALFQLAGKKVRRLATGA